MLPWHDLYLSFLSKALHHHSIYQYQHRPKSCAIQQWKYLNKIIYILINFFTYGSWIQTVVPSNPFMVMLVSLSLSLSLSLIILVSFISFTNHIIDTLKSIWQLHFSHLESWNYINNPLIDLEVAWQPLSRMLTKLED